MEPRKFFNELDSWIITLGCCYEKRADIILKDKECKELANKLMELKQRRNGTWQN